MTVMNRLVQTFIHVTIYTRQARLGSTTELLEPNPTCQMELEVGHLF